eukprot:IDg864t1
MLLCRRTLAMSPLLQHGNVRFYGGDCATRGTVRCQMCTIQRYPSHSDGAFRFRKPPLTSMYRRLGLRKYCRPVRFYTAFTAHPIQIGTRTAQTDSLRTLTPDRLLYSGILNADQQSTFAKEGFIESPANQTEAVLIEELAAGFSAKGSLSFSPGLSDVVQSDRANPHPPVTVTAPNAPPVRNRRFFDSLRRGLRRFRAQLRRENAPVESFVEPSVRLSIDRDEDIELQNAEADLHGSALTWSRESPEAAEVPEGVRPTRGNAFGGLRRVLRSIRLRSSRIARERRRLESKKSFLSPHRSLPASRSLHFRGKNQSRLLVKLSLPYRPLPSLSPAAPAVSTGASAVQSVHLPVAVHIPGDVAGEEDEIAPRNVGGRADPSGSALTWTRESPEMPGSPTRQTQRDNTFGSLRRAFRSIRVRSRRNARERRASGEEPRPVAFSVASIVAAANLHVSSILSASSPVADMGSGPSPGSATTIGPSLDSAMKAARSPASTGAVRVSEGTPMPSNELLEYDTVHIDGEKVNIVSRAVRGDELSSDLRHIREHYKRVPRQKESLQFKGSPPWANEFDASTVRPPTNT